MSRFTLGAALGGAAVFFFDPEHGEDRRGRLHSLWRENRDTAQQVGAGVSQAAETMRPLVRRVKRGLEQRDWAEAARARWVPGVAGVLVASTFGAGLIYFLDPQNGPARRRRVIAFLGEEQGAVKHGFRSVQKAAGAVRPRVRRAVAEASRAAEEVMAVGRG